MIYTITLNPSIDYIVQIDQLHLGELNRMKQDYKLPGGKGINVSRVLNQLNVPSLATGFLGGFTGGFIKDWLKNEGIQTGFVTVKDDTRINIKLKHGEETEINGLGPAISEEETTEFLQMMDKVTAGDIVILSGSVPPSLGNDFYDRIIQICKEKQADFMIDTTGQELLDALPNRPILIKPNHHELADLFGVKLENIEDLIPYGKKCLELGAQHVIVSMAGDGALLFTGEDVYFADALKGELKNSVGAGDSMIAGFVGTYDQTNDPVKSFAAGVATGGATAFSTDLAEKDLINELLPQVKVTKITGRH
ncbi:1-phosphofructokinase [Listeria welshimeri]|uniref:Tagatose-6-phosphate kinase n=2 Tax=Listeria welshimeri TaxID=1643 RepID=A0A7X0W6U5_LISWE|nr:1-phosphofructokinase [Listeria welshimeri]MBC1323998.1 1-phosphofructokinase [Listeria welshimeri]MBC1410105.1 1-phosphofructokinase [Listeria welshimeri]MBC1414326.1 1-phosphofructokinase [Listeria welshimeri]MBC1453005.1 1-phosphofructokinase [Listeria welshimeri]MBC1610823.1 1-phosphofructokinase [Listeria welshimeri]